MAPSPRSPHLASRRGRAAPQALPSPAAPPPPGQPGHHRQGTPPGDRHPGQQQRRAAPQALPPPAWHHCRDHPPTWPAAGAGQYRRHHYPPSRRRHCHHQHHRRHPEHPGPPPVGHPIRGSPPWSAAAQGCTAGAATTRAAGPPPAGHPTRGSPPWSAAAQVLPPPGAAGPPPAWHHRRDHPTWPAAGAGQYRRHHYPPSRRRGVTVAAMPPRQRIARRPPQALPSPAPPPPPGAPGATAGRAPRAGLTTLTSRGTTGRAPRVGFTTLTSRGTPVGHHASGSPPWSEDHPTLASHRRGQGCTAGAATPRGSRATTGVAPPPRSPHLATAGAATTSSGAATLPANSVALPRQRCHPAGGSPAGRRCHHPQRHHHPGQPSAGTAIATAGIAVYRARARGIRMLPHASAEQRRGIIAAFRSIRSIRRGDLIALSSRRIRNASATHPQAMRGVARAFPQHPQHPQPTRHLPVRMRLANINKPYLNV